MAVRKVFTDSSSGELEAYLNDYNQCYIQIMECARYETMQNIVLDLEDLEELINELVYIREQMTKE